MGGVLAIFLLFAHLLLLPDTSSSSPLCTDSRAPVTLKTPLAFCPYNGSVCCNSTKDLQLQKQFEAMNVSDPACASLLKSILCAVNLHYHISLGLYQHLSFKFTLISLVAAQRHAISWASH
uniref:Uncharacterized protein n=1 Tax=Nelumbo nucifera TaxID=4432 RepID=A0A822YPC4_NELNU|nr:TPA_asm: hypothetical protein HUJ06_009969 [Nelumbo nucifera]